MLKKLGVDLRIFILKDIGKVADNIFMKFFLYFTGFVSVIALYHRYHGCRSSNA
jgi:hypothetical protein